MVRPCNNQTGLPPGSIGREDLPHAQIHHVTETGSPRRQLVQIQKVRIKGVSSGDLSGIEDLGIGRLAEAVQLGTLQVKRLGPDFVVEGKVKV